MKRPLRIALILGSAAILTGVLVFALLALLHEPVVALALPEDEAAAFTTVMGSLGNDTVLSFPSEAELGAALRSKKAGFDLVVLPLGAEAEALARNAAVSPRSRAIPDRTFTAAFPSALLDAAGGVFIPLLWSPSGIYYNRALLSSLGAEAPTTWEDFLALLSKARARGLPGLILPGKEAGRSFDLLRSLALASGGPELHDALLSGTRDAATEAAIASYYGLISAGFVQRGFQSYTDADAAELILADRALAFYGSTDFHRLVPVERETALRYLPFPSFPGRQGLAQDGRLVVAALTPRGAGNLRARRLARDLATAELQGKLVAAQGPRHRAIPANKGAPFTDREGRVLALALQAAPRVYPAGLSVLAPERREALLSALDRLSRPGGAPRPSEELVAELFRALGR